MSAITGQSIGASHHMVVYGRQRHDGTTESYWSVYEGDEANARRRFDEWNNLPPTDALYPFMKTRGWRVINVLPCDERGCDPQVSKGAAILNCGGVGRKLVPPAQEGQR
jgi:hypothetical protein